MPLFSEDLDLLSQVLEKVCDERGLSRTTPEAERIGAVIIQLYRQGKRIHACIAGRPPQPTLK
ncbi:hypothetical protein [Rhizobium leguminosarum]|uniref:hypothetical protein n=1 Tax=Rhizobium leguminosarum TaxID=384 RepID=UPI003F9737CF